MVGGTEDRKMSVCIYAFITKAAPLVAPGIAVADKAKADADKAAADAKAKAEAKTEAEANPSDKNAADTAAAVKAAGDAAKATADATAANSGSDNVPDQETFDENFMQALTKLGENMDKEMKKVSCERG